MVSFMTWQAGAQQAQNPFRFQEATVAGIHDALASGQLTCVQLTKLYLDRIEAFNLQFGTAAEHIERYADLLDAS